MGAIAAKDTVVEVAGSSTPQQQQKRLQLQQMPPHHLNYPLNLVREVRVSPSLGVEVAYITWGLLEVASQVNLQRANVHTVLYISPNLSCL